MSIFSACCPKKVGYTCGFKNIQKLFIFFDLKTGLSFVGKLLIPISIISILVSIVALSETFKINCDHLDQNIIVVRKRGRNGQQNNLTEYGVCKEQKMTYIVCLLGLIIIMSYSICYWRALIIGIKNHKSSKVEPAMRMLYLWGVISAMTSFFLVYSEDFILFGYMAGFICITSFYLYLCVKSLRDSFLLDECSGVNV